MHSQLSDTRQRNSSVYTVDQVSEILGISRTSAYKAVHNGEIPSIRIGKRILIPKSEVKYIVNTATAIQLGDRVSMTD